MSKQCAICGKGSKMGGKRNLLRGKYNPTKSKRKKPNLQRVRLSAETLSKAEISDVKRVLLCAKCLKKLYK